MRKKITLLASAGILFLGIGSFLLSSYAHDSHAPLMEEPVGEDEEGPDKEARVRAYHDLIHRAAPGVNWREIEVQNAIRADEYKNQFANKGAAAFAGGLISGDWHERGNNNTSGRMSSFAYRASDNSLFAMSDAGTLWKTNPPNGSWTLLNDDYVLRSKVLAITPITGSSRILMARDSNLVYSDNNGATINVAGGISYATSWGGNYVSNIVALNDANRSVYALVQGWNASPWAARVFLYHSTDSGKNFTKIYTFNNAAAEQVSLFSPYNSNQLYALAVNPSSADSLFSVSGNTVSLVNATTAFPGNVSRSVLTGLMNGTTLQLYALLDDKDIFQSSNNGATWTSVSTITPTSWRLLSSSTKTVGNLFYGAVEAFRSTTGGTSFTKVNAWTDYYPAPGSKLHADIQAINFFHDASGNEFCIIGTDGGAYYSTSYLASVYNMSLTGLRVNQLWNHITDPNDPSVLFSGMQDQGLCHTTTAGGTGLINQTQIISGDYGQMRITGGGNILWAEYPGGNMYLYSALATSPVYQAIYNLQGSQKSNAGWLLPTCAIPGALDEILLGGGNITGGNGSYLAKLSYNSGSVYATQFPFNFRTASANGTSGLSSLAISLLNTKLWYAATEDGTFFWSNNSGTSWNKTASFAGVKGFWLYGATIAPSLKSKGTVYYGGSGYSNPGVYVSHDSGTTFTAMSTGLPATLVNALTVSPGDSLIFAATDAGPYVYVTSQSQWYPLLDANTPGCVWKSVEYLPSIRTARFSTYGRGVWDFGISSFGNPSTSVAGTPVIGSTVSIYPNPAVSGQSVYFQGLPAQPAQLAIYDAAGRLSYRGAWSGSGAIPLPALTPGVYSYIVQQERKEIQRKAEHTIDQE